MINKSYLKISFLGMILWLIGASPHAFGQLGPGTYTTVIASIDQVSPDAMVQLDYPSLFKISSQPSGGIRGTCNSCGLLSFRLIKLRVWAYDPQAPDGRGAIIYGVSNTSAMTPDNFVETALTIPATSVFNSPIPGNDLKKAAQRAGLYSPDGCAETQPLTWREWFYNHIFFLRDPLEERCLKYFGKSTQPVIVELDIPTAASVRQIKIPGVNGSNPMDAGDLFFPKTAKVYVNGQLTHTYHTSDTGDPHTINVTMGDEVKFEISGTGQEVPNVQGVPQTWLANFAGESKYYCSPSVIPGEFNPWVGFDSNVHGSALRRYDQFPDFQRNVPNWNHSSSAGTYTWSWVAQRRADPSKTSYTTSHTWNKQKTMPKTQRNSQKEGLDMELLRKWPKWGSKYTSFGSYNGEKYLLGLDPDEILYLDSQYPDTRAHAPGHGLLSPPHTSGSLEPWQLVPNKEGNTPSLNVLINAYRKNREAVINGNTAYQNYYTGYEIQDDGTSTTNPNGTGIGNNKSPGLVTITVGGKAIKMKFNVSAPVTSDPGFYSIIKGTQWPTQGGMGIPYTLTHIDPAKVDGYILEYMNVNSSGKAYTVTHKLRDEPQSVKNIVMSSGRWTKAFDIASNSGYNTITAFYQRTATSQKVMIGGKELLEIQLRFTGVPGDPDPGNPNPPGIALGEGRGEGGYVYVENYRSASDGPFNFQRFGRYIDPYVTAYTFPANTQVSFSTLDGDPHTFIQVVRNGTCRKEHRPSAFRLIP